jgi:transmembrane sensor
MKVDLQILKRYLEGDEKDGDKEKILNWFSDLQYESDLRKQYHRYWDELVNIQDLKGYNGSKILDKIYHKIKLEESCILQEKRVMTRIFNILCKVAAILFIPLITFLFIHRNNLIPATTEIARSEIYSPLGTRTMFYLPDGSNGWLNGGSYLEFPTEFKGKSREVLLKGEAYFNVKSDPKKPFIVSGTDIEVVAYGTSFNVLAYPDDQTVKVTLESGNIKIMGKQDGRIQDCKTLKPDQMYISDLKTSSYKIITVDANKITSWKEGKLVFRNDPFKEVVKKINRWYNVNIVIKDKVMESYTYLATFEDETLDEVLKLLELSAPIGYKNIGRERREDGTFEKRKIELYYKP